jgi:nuclear transport factor 2 (NTF2) superfamily protein
MIMNLKTPIFRIVLLPAVCTLFFALFPVSCMHHHPVLPTDEESHAAIWTKIEMANDTWAAGDPMGFIACAAEDVTWMDDLAAPVAINGKEALTAYLEAFKGQIPPHEHELLNPLFQYYGEIVIVTYHYQGTFDGVPADPWKVTSVYRYEDGDWFSVHENWSLVKSGS